MGAREKLLQQVRLMHVAFVITWFLLVFILQVQLKPAARPIEPAIVGAIALVAVSSVSIGWTMRRKQLAMAVEVLRREPEDGAALVRWRFANILSFAFAESVTLFGFVLKVMGASWGIAGCFFAGGLILLLLWWPQLEASNS
jgi:hypothetical protein